MQSSQVGDKFELRANMDGRIASLLPSWYFLKDDGGNKDDALYLDGVYEQAEQLKSQHSDQLVA
jgi:hypothetical protein